MAIKVLESSTNIAFPKLPRNFFYSAVNNKYADQFRILGSSKLSHEEFSCSTYMIEKKELLRESKTTYAVDADTGL